MSNAELLALWLALAAGRLRLRLPDNAGLRRLSRPLLTQADADAENLDAHVLARAIEAGAEQLYAELETNPAASPLARICGLMIRTPVSIRSGMISRMWPSLWR